MNRKDMLNKLQEPEKVWDMVVVGGGATGLGVAVDAATRGYSVVLLEMADFAKSTSSRSTKLVHGGVRYLQKGDVALVLEALRERGRMKANAPHLVKDQAFVISNYTYWDNFLYFCGLTLYDLLSFGFGYGRSRFISPTKVMEYLPTSVKKGLKGGIVYHDGQFVDSRMAINLAQTCADNGGVILNKAKVSGIVHDQNGKVAGVKFVDMESGKEMLLKAKSVINACGILVDDLMAMDSPGHSKMVTPSQGVHLVLDMKFLQSDYAIMVPKTSDGRVLFAVPWHNKVVVGTTDIMRPVPEIEPKPLKEEIDFILKTASLYMDPAPTYADIESVLYVYGSDQDAIMKLIAENPEYGKKLSDKYDYTVAEVVWAVREEMAREVEDVLARRVRLLFVDAREAIKAAPLVAEVMAKELGKDQAWIDEEVKEFTELAGNYIAAKIMF